MTTHAVSASIHSGMLRGNSTTPRSSGGNIKRVLIGAAPAAIITIGLFAAMRAAIGDFAPPDDPVPVPELATITPMIEEPGTIYSGHSLPDRPDDAVQPPPPPEYTISKEEVGLLTPTYEGAAPTTFDFGRVDITNFDPAEIDETEARPIYPPVPVYPDKAIARRLEGACEVKFDVDTRGKPKNIQANCTDQVFRRAAEKAVAQVEFSPKIVRGRPAERRNVIYPLEFRLEK